MFAVELLQFLLTGFDVLPQPHQPVELRLVDLRVVPNLLLQLAAGLVRIAFVDGILLGRGFFLGCLDLSLGYRLAFHVIVDKILKLLNLCHFLTSLLILLFLILSFFLLNVLDHKPIILYLGQIFVFLDVLVPLGLRASFDHNFVV